MRADDKGREILRTIYCPTPYCYGWQDVVRDERAKDGELVIGGCRCGYLGDDMLPEELDRWANERADRERREALDS